MYVDVVLNMRFGSLVWDNSMLMLLDVVCSLVLVVRLSFLLVGLIFII